MVLFRYLQFRHNSILCNYLSLKKSSFCTYCYKLQNLLYADRSIHCTKLHHITQHCTAHKKLKQYFFPQLKEERTHTGGTESLNVWVRSNNIITQPYFEFFWDFWGILALCGNFLWYFGISKKNCAFWGFFAFSMYLLALCKCVFCNET